MKEQEIAYLLDANILIAVLDENKDDPNHQKAKQLYDKLKSKKAKMVITSLIRYEILRGIKSKPFDEAQKFLDDFIELEITDLEANPSAKIFHAMPRVNELDDVQKKNYRHNFDIFHYVVSKIYNLYLINVNEKDFEKIDKFVNQLPNNPFKSNIKESE